MGDSVWRVIGYLLVQITGVGGDLFHQGRLRLSRPGVSGSLRPPLSHERGKSGSVRTVQKPKDRLARFSQTQSNKNSQSSKVRAASASQRKRVSSGATPFTGVGLLFFPLPPGVSVVLRSQKGLRA